jgi:hypothetical protein
MTFKFTCSTCGRPHEGIPTFGAEAPSRYYAVPKHEREARCSLGTDDCVIDERAFFVRGSIEIPVHGSPEPFAWGVWASLSKESFAKLVAVYDQKQRSHVGPFFGWLNASLRPYPETANLKTMVHLRNNGIRPAIEVEPTDHPLAVEQREGISADRLAEIYRIIVHGEAP